MEWYEIKPYMVEDTDIEGYKVLADHAGSFLFLVHRDKESHIRMFLGIKSDKITAVTTLDGMEVMRCDPFKFSGFKKYRRYKLKRHCALPIADETVERASVYRVLDREVQEPAFLAVNAKSTVSMSRIHGYIRCIENGQSPDSIFRHFSAGTAVTKISALRQSKIQMARTKIGKFTHLFVCEIIIGANTLQAMRAIETIFPFGTMVGSTVGTAKARNLATKPPSVPMFGGSKHPLLSETELLSFIGFPTDEDIKKTGIQHGKTTSYTSSRRFTGVDETVDIDG